MLNELSIEEIEKAKNLRIAYNMISNSITEAINKKYQETLEELLNNMGVEPEKWVEMYEQACEVQSNVISEFYGTDMERAIQLEAMESKIASMLRNQLVKTNK